MNHSAAFTSQLDPEIPSKEDFNPRDGASNAYNFTDQEIASKEDFKPKDDVDTAHNSTGESTVQSDRNRSAVFMS